MNEDDHPWGKHRDCMVRECICGHTLFDHAWCEGSCYREDCECGAAMVVSVLS